MMKKIKNNTGGDLTVNGTFIAAGQYYQLQQFEELSWRDNSEVEALIDSADLVFNDGTSDIVDTVKAKKLLNANEATSLNHKMVPSSNPTIKSVFMYESATDTLQWRDASQVGSGRNSIALFISDVDGQGINTGSYSVISFKTIAGNDGYGPTNVTYIWGVVGETTPGGTLDIRLVKKSDGSVIGELNWDNETTPTLKTLNVTTNIPNGTNIVQLEGKRKNGAGKMYSSGIEVIFSV